MQIKNQKPRASLNKAFLRAKPKRSEIETFKKNLVHLIDGIKDKESEEFHKNLVIEFLKKTYYDPNFYINTKGRNDLVIHIDKKPESNVGVIVEVKSPTNKAEMMSAENINSKAFHELILYFLRERIINRNLDIKYIVATNLYEWFIFDANTFEKLFVENKGFIKSFNDFEAGRLASKKTDFFYNEIASEYIKSCKEPINATYFDIRDYKSYLRGNDKKNDAKLVSLFKVFSAEHLLKLPFKNDSNTLDKKFYEELLHIVGLRETKKGNKILIERNSKANRNSGSIIESTITQLDSLGKIRRLKNASMFGDSDEDRLFGVALELTITWLNRILFLKLLESQLLAYHKKDNSYAFLNSKKVGSYDDLNTLFFQVLAHPAKLRNNEILNEFVKVPYLNSSLFEPTELEHSTIFISNLVDDQKIPLFSGTILKDNRGKKRTGQIILLEYFFQFLDAYDFSSEGAEDIQEENKTLINASVLGLIFEKINGYKDGSFFTPGFITMFICRTIIREAIVQKFNDLESWNCASLEDLYDKIEDRSAANDIINSIKICDPAVGSGHFLVSALNELIVIKHELKILCDRKGKRLKEYVLEVVNDELIISDDDGDLFEYNPKSNESQRVQEAIFHEKQTLIENCLFGVDINANSVKICRLRLWIELLKNAYYRHGELETLPNIDINIKRGNSLVKRFELESSLGKALKKLDWTIESYKNAVDTYRNAENKAQKEELEELIGHIKSDFKSEISANDRKVIRVKNIESELFAINNQEQLFELDNKAKRKRKETIDRLNKELKTLNQKIDEIKNNKIYENAFEWRIEFPEVLDHDGKFIGFDAIVGNPPYVYRNAEIEPYKNYFKEFYFATSGNFDLYKFFIEICIDLVRKNGICSLITNSSYLLQTSFKKSREFILNNSDIELIVPLGGNVFKEAVVDSAISVFRKRPTSPKTKIYLPEDNNHIEDSKVYFVDQSRFKKNEGLEIDYLLDDDEWRLVSKLSSKFPTIESSYSFGVGINTGYIKEKLVSENKISDKYHPMVPGTGISKWGPVKTTGYIMYDKNFVKAQGDRGRTLPDEKFLSLPKILVVRTRNISLKERIIATIDYDKNYNLNRLSNIISENGASLEGLLGVLNSKLFNWLYSKRYFDYEIKPIYLRKSPLCNTNDKDLISEVKAVLNKRKKDSSSDISKELEKIDKLVFKLYDLSGLEIDLIESYFV